MDSNLNPWQFFFFWHNHFSKSQPMRGKVFQVAICWEKYESIQLTNQIDGCASLFLKLQICKVCQIDRNFYSVSNSSWGQFLNTITMSKIDFSTWWAILWGRGKIPKLQIVWEYLMYHEFIHMWSEFILNWYDFTTLEL